MKHLINTLYGSKGIIKIYSNDTAVIQQASKPDTIIKAKDVPNYMVSLNIHSSNDGHFQLGTWDQEDEL